MIGLVINGIDSVFMYLTKKLILLAAFWGISRKNLAIFSAQFGAIAFCFAFYIDKFQFGKNILPSAQYTAIITLGAILMFYSNTRFVINNYRDDDVISTDLYPYTKPFFRLFCVIIWYFVAHTAFKYPWPVNMMYLFGYIPGPWYFYYILVNQSPQNPLRLRGLLGNLFRSRVRAFAPKTTS